MRRSARIVFVTGTDTGVGKTVLTALLLSHLRQAGTKALAIKPFCSGGTEDVELLHSLQHTEMSRNEVNPYYFPEPVAPLVSARKHCRVIPFRAVTGVIQDVANQCDTLVIEGSGGLLVPLGEGYAVADLIAALSCEVLVVCRNRLGTINHTLLTVESLRNRLQSGRNKGQRSVARMKSRDALSSANNLKVVMMDSQKRDQSCATNPKILSGLLAPAPFFLLPFFKENPMKSHVLEKLSKKMQKSLARILR
jgi:dethiobiotin synthetase